MHTFNFCRVVCCVVNKTWDYTEGYAGVEPWYHTFVPYSHATHAQEMTLNASCLKFINAIIFIFGVIATHQNLIWLRVYIHTRAACA